MSALGLLTEEQKRQAFLKARTVTKIREGKLVRVTEEHYEEVLEMIRDNFHCDEPVHKAMGAKWGKDAIEMHMEALRQNISVMTVNEDNGEIMALQTNQVVKKGELHGMGEIEDEGFKAMLTFGSVCHRYFNLFEHFGVGEAVELSSLVTKRKYRQRGLGAQVVKASLAMIRSFGLGKICVKCEGSSLFTQKILEKEGMQCLYTCVYDEYEVDDLKMLEDTGIHTCVKMYGMIVE